MYSSEDLERFYFQYQTEAMPKGISIGQFCSRNKVPYNIFYKWYKDTRNKIVEVKVAATYHSIISTVKLQGRSAWDYLGKFFVNIFNGCRDFFSLRPGNIGLATCQ